MSIHGFARSLSSLYWSSAANVPGRGTPGGDALAEERLRKAEQLLEAARGCLPHLRRWLPQLPMQAHEAYQQRFDRGLAEARQGAAGLGGSVARSTMGQQGAHMCFNSSGLAGVAHPGMWCTIKVLNDSPNHSCCPSLQACRCARARPRFTG